MTACPQGPNLDECVTNMLQVLIPNLKDGYEPFGMPAIDPFAISNVTFNYKQQNINIRVVARNLTLHGFTSVKIRRSRSTVKPTSMRLEIDVFVPKIKIFGTYKAAGHFNQIQLKSKGRLNITVCKFLF